MVAVPFLTPLIFPLAVTVATFSFEDVYSDGENVFYREQKIENIKISNLTAEKKKEYIESIKMIKLQLIKIA